MSMARRLRGAITLIEITVAVLVGTMLFLAALRLFSGGLSTSHKGSEHLNNLGLAAVALAQIADDIAAAVRIDLPAAGGSGSRCELELLTHGGETPRAVSYQVGAGGLGLVRHESPSGAEHTFGRGRGVEVTFTRVRAAPAAGAAEGVVVAIRVYRHPSRGEEERLQRFVAAPNLRDNRALAMPGWRW